MVTQRIDRGIFFAYNKSMGKKERKNSIRTLARLLLPALCLLWLAFIFGNSLRGASSSSAQSSAVTDAVQDMAQVIAPGSSVATATGEDYERLHATIRQLAHFFEFAVLGGLLCWCYFAFTSKLRYLYLPFSALLLVPVVDEFLQLYGVGRATTAGDVIVDALGGVVGFLVAGSILLIAWLMIRRRQNNPPPRFDEDGVPVPAGYPGGSYATRYGN